MPFILTMGPQLSIVGLAVGATVGAPGRVEFSTTGAVGPVTWALLSSTAPGEWDSALTVEDGVASISAATVSTTGPFTVRVRATDTTRQPIEYSFVVRVVALPLTITGSISSWAIGVPVDDILTISGGSGVYVSSTILSGAFPAGVSRSLVGDELQISGTPTTPGAWSVLVRVTDSEGATETVALSGAIADLVVVSGSFPATVEPGDVLSLRLPITGGSGTYSSVAVQSGAKASWMTIAIDDTDVLLTGTVDDVGATYSFTLRVTDSSSSTGDSGVQSVEVIGTLWTPQFLATPAAGWFDWDSSITNVSGYASLWGNQGTAGGSVTQVTPGNRPEIIASGINGERVLRFDGGDGLITNSGLTATLQNVTAGWVFAVAKKASSDGSPTGRRVAVYTTPTTAARLGIYWDDGVSGGANKMVAGARRLDADTYQRVPYSSTSFGAWVMCAAAADYSARQVDLWVGGAIDSTLSSAFSGSGSTSNTASSLFTIGGGSGGTAAFAGDIACVVTGNTLLSTDDWARLFGWAAYSCALTADLPGAHAYLLGPPLLSTNIGWNPADKGAGCTLANYNISMSRTGGSTYESVRASKALSGKVYWETRSTFSATGGHAGSGISTSALSLSSATEWVGVNPTSCAVWGGHNLVYVNGASIYNATDSSIGPEIIYKHAYDADTGEYWIGTISIGWFTGDPAAGTSPIAALPLGVYYPCASDISTTPGVGLYDGSGVAPLVGAVPGGFTSYKESP